MVSWKVLLLLIVPIVALQLREQDPTIKVTVLVNKPPPCEVGCSTASLSPASPKSVVDGSQNQSRAAKIRSKAAELRKMQDEIRKKAKEAEKEMILDNLEEKWAEQDEKIRKAETQTMTSSLVNLEKEKQALEIWKKKERDEKDRKLEQASLQQDIGDKLKEISKSLEVNISAQLKRLKKFEEVEVDATEAIVRARREELQKNITAEEMARSLKTALQLPRDEARTCLNASKIFRANMASCNKTITCLQALRATFKAACVPYAIKKKARKQALAEQRRIAQKPAAKAPAAPVAPPISWIDKKAELMRITRKARALIKLMRLAWKRLSNLPPPPSAPRLPGDPAPPADRKPAPLRGLRQARAFIADASKKLAETMVRCKKLWALQKDVKARENNVK